MMINNSITQFFYYFKSKNFLIKIKKGIDN